MYSIKVLTYIALLVCIKLVEGKDEPVVETTHGQVAGKVLKTLFKNNDYYGFMGIPYAQPPIGELRFMDPQPIEPWDGVLRATKEKPACLQFNNNVKKGASLGVYGVEDCLYLDIFTPAADENKRAVVMFIFTDHFINSYNKSKDYAPDFFIEEDVVVVTISHRLSALGFLSLESEVLPGNAGLKDIVEGLEWVKDNIEYFGGDPDKITLMGVQGGAAGIDLLLYTKAKDLFNAAIFQSGTSWTSAYLQEDVKERAFKLGTMVNITTSSGKILVKELQNLSDLNLILARDLHASPDDHFKITQKSVITFTPIVEKQPGGLVTEYPEDSDQKINIPIMMGFNSREGFDSTMHYLIEPRYIGFLNKDFPVLIPRRVKFAFDPTTQVFEDITEEIKHYYFKGKPSMKKLPELVTMFGDILINYGLDYTAKVYSERSTKPVYYYHFDYYSILNENKNNLIKHITVEDGTWGAVTGDEMCYLFKCPNLKNEYLRLEKGNAEEIVILRKMVKMWTNFAKYGNPTPEDDEVLEGLKWPPYTLEKKEYLHIEKQIDVKTDLLKTRFDFWDNFIGKWERAAVKGIITEHVKDEL